jgi:hypothetical protein
MTTIEIWHCLFPPADLIDELASDSTLQWLGPSSCRVVTEKQSEIRTIVVGRLMNKPSFVVIGARSLKRDHKQR